MTPRLSIRWRLLLGYGIALALVLILFGWVGQRLVRENLFRRVDGELQRLMTTVVASLRPSPRFAPDGVELGASAFLGDEELGLFAENLLGPCYFVVSSVTGSEADDRYLAPEDLGPLTLDEGKLDRGLFRTRGDKRELILAVRPRFLGQARWTFRELAEGRRGPRRPFFEPPIGVVLVGCPLESVYPQLRRAQVGLALTGGVLLAGGLGLGWVFSSRALKPIGDMAQTARAIAEGGYSTRIPTQGSEDELSALAWMLNESFDELERARERQARFTADASHELRTPLFVVISEAQSMLARERDASAYQEGFHVCLRAADRMRALIDALLVLAREEDGARNGARTVFRLDTLVGEEVASLDASAKGMKVRLNCTASESFVEGDATQVALLCRNLVSNAIAYNREGGEVHVEVEEDDGEARLTVRDTGLGIAETDLPHIFDRFYRVDGARTADGHVGLGLSICRSIASSHNARVVVESVLDEGSMFRVIFKSSPNSVG